MSKTARVVNEHDAWLFFRMDSFHLFPRDPFTDSKVWCELNDHYPLWVGCNDGFLEMVKKTEVSHAR